MKKTLPALLLALSLLLTGCASILERDYQSVTPHSETPDSEGDPSTLRVETYQGLVNAILYFVLQGQEEGTLRLYNYTRDVDTDLNAACVEVAQEDPLGAYALDFIKFESTHIVSYYEVKLHFTYRRTQEQVDSIISVVGTNAIRQELCDALSQFRPEVTLRIGYFDRDEEYLNTLLQEAYYDTPQSAFGLPQAVISLYPDTGYQRVVEFQLTYPFHEDQLRAWQNQVLEQAELAVSSLRGKRASAALTQIVRVLHQNTSYDPDGTGSLQFLLSGAPVRSEGLALALTLFARQLDLSCQVVEGTLEGEPHFWTVVNTSSGYRHLDPSLEDILFYSDAQMAEMGYEWDRTSVPTCGDPSPALPDLSLENFLPNLH